MSRKINYEDAIENLQKMFAGVDKEVINTILTMHKGRLDPTIEDLLKLTNDAVDDDNIFDDGPSKKNYEPAIGDFEDEDDHARQTQEEKDMQLALQLQEQEIRDSKRAEQNYRAQQQQPRGYGQSQQQPGGYGQPQQLFPQQSQDRFQQQYQYQPSEQQQRPQRFQPQYQGVQPNAEPVKEVKKKKKFAEKLKDAKVKFFSLFKKGKKKGKEGVGNNMAGGYAEIDNLDDIGNLNAGVGGMRLDDDLDDIPDIQANPYSGNPIPRRNPIPRKDPMPKIQKPREDSSSPSEASDEDERGINEEAKANFKFEPEMQYRKPVFDDMRQNNGASYPKFGEEGDDGDLKEYYNDKKIGDQGEGLDLV